MLEIYFYDKQRSVKWLLTSAYFYYSNSFIDLGKKQIMINLDKSNSRMLISDLDSFTIPINWYDTYLKRQSTSWIYTPQ